MNQHSVLNKNSILNITPKAEDRIVELLNFSNNKNLKLRIYVVGGSCCSDLEYCFAFEERLEDDILLKYQQVEVIVDPISVRYLYNTTLDYKNSEEGNSFVIINHQKMKKSCDCDCGGQSSCC